VKYAKIVLAILVSHDANRASGAME
jgi:hypothetical protein